MEKTLKRPIKQNEEVNALVLATKNGCSQSLKRLHTLYKGVINIKNWQHLSPKDITAERLRLIYEAAKTFKSDKATFCTWLWKKSRFVQIRERTKDYKHYSVVTNNGFNTNGEMAAPEPLLNMKDLIASCPKPELREFAILRFVEGRTYEETGAAMKISAASAQQLQKKFLTFCRETI